MHKESVQYSINLMNGICLIDRYLNVRMVNQRRSLGSLANASDGGGSKTTDGDDNPFYSTNKPIQKLSLVPSSSESTASSDNPFLSSAKPVQGLSLIPTSSESVSSSENPFLSSSKQVQTVASDSNPFLSTIQRLPLNPSSSEAVDSSGNLSQTSNKQIKRLPLTPNSGEMVDNPFLSSGERPPVYSEATICSSPFNQAPPTAPPTTTPVPLFRGHHHGNLTPLPPPPPLPLMSFNQSPITPGFPPPPPLPPFCHDPLRLPPPLPLPPFPPPPHLLPPPPPLPFFPQLNNTHSPTTDCSTGNVSNFDSVVEVEDCELLNGDQSTTVYEDVEGGRNGLHQSRLHANDHPAWLTRETKEKLTQYHLETLEKSLNMLRESMSQH